MGLSQWRCLPHIKELEGALSRRRTAQHKRIPTPRVLPPEPNPFRPRETFDFSPDTPKSFYLGHHHAGLARMREALNTIGLIIECRDFRVPISSWNPLLEQSLATTSNSDRPRIIVYTHCDLAPPSMEETKQLLRDFHLQAGHAREVFFTTTDAAGSRSYRDIKSEILETLKTIACERDSLLGLRAMVVGMPNAGKSTLLNGLRAIAVARSLGGASKVARTGVDPGITRKMSSPVRVVEPEKRVSTRTSPDSLPSAGVGEGVFLIDTPGVFMPYVPDPERMIKLALVGCVRDGIVPPETVVDYLLFRLNLELPPESYHGYYKDPYQPDYVRRLHLSAPTNNISEFLDTAGMRMGHLQKGGIVNLSATAQTVLHKWRKGGFGRMVLDEVTPDALEAAMVAARGENPLSMNQARKREKEARKEYNAAKRAGGTTWDVSGVETTV
ncbi:P-loop containing nucleoside triphosphate hydrolase protein [Dichotomopilus funicola]|uniref:P-loop containing nucleoside triphosphate hydrolase protein n=1 Tax=Dichotomopilus funicola TaxID=1934379 RepID=A0AAN6V6H7_9PEZI|nr:P-loop containing nucleoside triphosphate hydrolase protein [Dichotomopilus funicola]